MKFLTIVKKYSFDKYISGLLFVVLTIIAIIRALQHFYIVDAYESVQFSLWWHIPFNLFMWWSWFFFIPFLYWMITKMSVVSSRLFYWSIVCFILPIVIVFIRQALASLIITSVLVGYKDFATLLHTRLFVNPWVWLDIIVYFVIITGIRVVEYRHENMLNELKFEQLQVQLVQSQLNALKSQLRPHFLFNTLNTISTLILKVENAEAQRMLALLNDLLRTTVFESERQEISLEEELRFVNHYLEIEKVRFSDKLVVREDIAGDTLNAQVPNFLLQPIVENAIYHAIAPKISNGIIWITSRKDDGHLSLFVQDNGPGITSAKKKTREGIGLKITKERLVHLFGNNHTFELENVSTGGVRVIIRIPFVNNDYRMVAI